MFRKLTNKFKLNPMLYYAFSIAASWAGVGSLMNSITLTRTNGLITSMIWGLGNSVACILFGITAYRLPTLRNIMRTKAAKYVIGFMSIFQLWINMNGIREIFADTVIGTIGGTVIVYAVCIIFIVLLIRFGMIRNVLTDSASWCMVYGLIFVLTLAAVIQSKGAYIAISMGTDLANLEVGLTKGFLLLPGPFTYPYFYELMDYNDSNKDYATKTNIVHSFALGGAVFGLYMLFTYVLAIVRFSPALNLLKAVLVSLIGVSTISTFIYSEYIVFGKKIGLIVDSVAVLLWPFLISLGVMGVWTLMAKTRIYLIAVLLIVAGIKRFAEIKKEATR